MKRQPTVHQPDLHLFATHVARRLNCTHVIDIGCAQPKELAKIHPEAKIIGLGIDVDLRSSRSDYPWGRWVDWNAESNVLETVSPEMVAESVIVSTIDSERPATPHLVESLKQLLEYAPAALITATDTRSSATRFRCLLEPAGLRIDFMGLTAGDNVHFRKDTPLAILGNNHRPPMRQAPAGWRVVAMMASYNEEDIIVPSITGLIEQGVEVYLIDNWSTDRTVERAEKFLDRGVIAIERFPAEGPSDTFPYASILSRKTEISMELEADWYLHMDVDEIRHSPWPGTTLKDALYHVDSQGFNAVDHTVLKFFPTDNGYLDGSNFERYFRFYRPAGIRNYQIKTWKNTGKRVVLGDAGHRVAFAGRRVYPYNFVYKHYPIRSQQHGERKIFSERQARMDAQELAAGWHGHYQRYLPGHNFLADPSELLSFDEADIRQEFLVERLSNIGPDERAAWARRRQDRPPWRKLAGRVRRRLRRR